MDVVNAIEALGTDSGEPKGVAKIVDCGVLEDVIQEKHDTHAKH